MTNYKQLVRIVALLLLTFSLGHCNLMAQETGFKISGKILESGTGMPIQQAIVSIGSSSESTNTDSLGNFSISLATQSETLMITYPGYYTTTVYTTEATEIVVYLTQNIYKSSDEEYTSNLGIDKLSNSTNAVSLVSKSVFSNTASSSFDQSLNGKVPGLHIIEQSGMPGHSSWVNLRGISSIFARNEPLVFIDGMIHEINYPNNQLIEGHLLNPMDVIDVDDLVDVSVMKAGEGQLGSAGSNGLININTEQNRVTSSSIIFKMYGGVALPNSSQEVMDAEQFKPYFTDILKGEGFSDSEINHNYPWLNGGSTSSEYYRYNNNTDWQKEMSKASALQKYYIFIKGGDDIATYNISSGFMLHGSEYDKWRYSKYNLRLNGKINITNKLYLVPNVKLSLSDSYLSNMGPTSEHNPVTSSLLKPALMAPHEKSKVDGTDLYPYDDVDTVFYVSNPAVLIDDAMGSARNFQFLGSIKIGYDITSKLSISNLIGASVNNDRQNIFIPDLGVVQIDPALNSPQDMVTEFRSLQNHTVVSYKTTYNRNHNFNLNGGIRMMQNSYKNNFAKDLNTPSDDFRTLGKGSNGTAYLRENGGALNELNWISYFGDFNYSFQDKYYLRASMSFDGASVFNENNRYNFYPSVFAAWRVNSEDFLRSATWIDDLKLRTSFSQTGNMFSNAYGMSKSTYTGRRYNNLGVVVRDYNANKDLSAEKKSTVTGGVDLGFGKKAYNLHLDYHYSMVNNLIINQSLPYNFGFTDYLDNGGALAIKGIELGADARMYPGNAVLILDAAVTYQTTKIKSFEFINPETEYITTQVPGAEYVAMEGNPTNAFFGYKTNGIYNTDADANGILGPNGKPMGAGDVRFVDVDGNNIINDKDKQIIGNPNPDLFGSVLGTLKIKRFEISTLFTYSIGGDVYNYVRYKTTSMDTYANQSIEVLDRWKPGMTGATLPKATMGDPNGNNVFSDRWIEDGSFVKFKQLMVSYTTPNIFNFRKETKFYITGTNLFTFSNYSGYEPETMYQNSPYYMGIDYGKIPLARTIIIGIQLSL